MRNRSISVLSLATLCAAFVMPAGANAERAVLSATLKAHPSERPPLAAPGEAVVTYRRGVDRRSLSASVTAAGGRVVRNVAARSAVVAAHASVADLVARLEADPNVAYAEPNYLRYLTAVPNDPSFGQQWGLNNDAQAHVVSESSQTSSGTADADMDVAEAWDIEQGDPGTVIAIMDSGVDTTHPDLLPNLWTNPGEIAADGIDNDGNLLVDDVNGWDFADNDASVYEPNSAYFGHDHGTHVAGIAAAAMNNGIGIAGVCPSCRIMVLKVFEPADTDKKPGKDTMIGTLGAEIDAINYAIEMGADVINGSFASPAWSKSERAALNRAANAGISLVFAASNSNLDNDLFLARDDDGDGQFDVASPEFPASYDLPSLISVGATNHRDENGYSTACATIRGSPEFPCAFTNWGHESVDLSAPGVDILSTLPNNTYAAFDGTSMAAPAVAGLVGLLRSTPNDYTPAQVRNALLNSVDTPDGLDSLFHALPGAPTMGQFTLTGGRANAAAALTASTVSTYAKTDGNIRGATSISSSSSGTVAWPHDVNDVYKRRLTGNRNYKVVLNGPSGADFDLLIYSPGTKDVWQIQGGCFGFSGECKLVAYPGQTDADESARFTTTTTGTYYFQVAAFPGFAGNYTLKITRI